MRNKKLCFRFIFCLIEFGAFISAVSLVSCANSQRYAFEGHIFNSESEVFEFAEKKLKKEVQIINENEQLISDKEILDKNNESKLDFNNLDEKIEKDIKVELLNLNDVNIKSLGDTNAFYIDDAVKNENKLDLKENNELSLCDKMINQCKNSKITGYFFRNHFIESESKNDIGLLQTQINDGQQSKYIQVHSESEDGNLKFGSIPIFLHREKNNWTNEAEVRKIIRNFLKTHLNRIYAVNTENKINYFTNQYDVIGKMNLSNDESLYLPANDGQADYVIDIKKNNQHDYYGPYVSDSQFGIKEFQNNNLWHTFACTDDNDKKSNTVNEEALIAQKDSVAIMKFFDILIPDFQLENNQLFNISYLDKETKSYKEFMLANAPKVWKKALEVSNQLYERQRKSIILKAPILYSVISEEIVRNQLGNECVRETNKYFLSMYNYVDKVIKCIFPPSTLKSIKNPTNKLTVSTMFEIDKRDNKFLGMPSLRFNLNLVRKEYPYFINAIKLCHFAIQNRMNLNSCLTYNPNFINTILDVSEDKNVEIARDYELLWKIFTSKNFHDFINYITRNENNISVDEKIIMFIEYYLKFFSAFQSIENNYQVQSNSVLENTSNSNNSDFFKDVPNASELITAAEGDYGKYFLLRQRLGSKSLNKFSSSEPYSGFIYSFFNDIFKLIKNSTESLKKIVTKPEFLLKSLNKLTLRNNSPLIKKIVDKFSSAITNHKTNVYIHKSLCNVGDTATEISNFISDIWSNKIKTPVSKLIYRFLDTNCYIDNNSFTSSVLSEQKTIAYNENFLKQLMPPIKINEPHLDSLIYTNGKTYKVNELDLAKLDLLYLASQQGKHEINNVKIYYSLLNTNQLTHDLNNNKWGINELLNKSILNNSIEQVENRLVNSCKKYIEKTDINGPVVSYIDTHERIEVIKDYEFNIDNWEFSLYTLPQSDKNSKISSSQNKSKQNLLNIFGKYYDENKKEFIINKNSSAESWNYFVLSDSNNKFFYAGDSRDDIDCTDYIIKKNLPYCQNMKKNDDKNFKQYNEELVEKKSNDVLQGLQKVFKIDDKKNEKKLYFKDRQDAIEWKIKNSNLYKTGKTTYIYKFVYNHEQTFTSIDQFKEWVHANIKLV